MPPTRLCRTCGIRREPAAFSDRNARRCNDCKVAVPACGERKMPDAYRTSQSRKCIVCVSAPRPERPEKPCQRCGETRPAADYVKRGKVCQTCREAGIPSPARPCVRCHETKPADAFAWSDGRRATGCYPTRRRVCSDCLATEAREREARAAARRTTWTIAGRQVRRCKHCTAIKDLQRDFYISRHAPNGTPLYEYRCKACQIESVSARAKRQATDPATASAKRAQKAAWQRAWRARNPDKSRELQQRYRERLKSDHARHAAYLEAQRISHRLRRERRDGVSLDDIRALKLAGPTPPRPKTPQELPSAPLAAAIEAVIAARRDDTAREAVCAQAGIASRQLWAWRAGEIVAVQFAIADRVITRLGLTWWTVWDDAVDPVAHARARAAFEGAEVAA